MKSNLSSSACAFGFLLTLGNLGLMPAQAAVVDFTAEQGDLRLNQIQVIGTHNSYHLRLSEGIEQLLISALGDEGQALVESLQYDHRPLPEQFELLGIRQIELDIFADPNGGLYANPVGRQLAAAQGLPVGPEFDPTGVMEEPGLKVLHIQDIDFRSNCLTFTGCLQGIKQWSEANADHVPILVLVEAKDSPIPSFGEIDSTQPIPFTSEVLEQVDAEIRSVFSEEHLLTPDDVRGSFATLNEAILTQGWPTLEESKGQILFALDNTNEVLESYVEGYPSLQGRVLFTSSEPGTAEAAFLKLNDAFDPLIPEVVRQGYLVRTRADIPTQEVRLNDTTRRDAAFASGAHFISTDYPEPDLNFSEYSVAFPEGGTIRCNPLTTSQSCNLNSAAPAVPEPSTLVGLLLFGLGISRYRRSLTS